MKALPNLFFAALVFLTLSCSIDDDDMAPENLYGTWENSSLHEEAGLSIVNAYVFHENGTFEHKMTARQPNSSAEVGYNSVISGTFELSGNKLTLEETNWLSLPENSQSWHVSLDELVNVEWNRERNATLTLKDRKSQLEMDFGPCGPNALCAGPAIYFRVWR